MIKILFVVYFKDFKVSNVKYINEEGTFVLKVLLEIIYKIWSLNNLN